METVIVSIIGSVAAAVVVAIGKWALHRFRSWRASRRATRFGGAVIPHERVTRRGCSRL